MQLLYTLTNKQITITIVSEFVAQKQDVINLVKLVFLGTGQSHVLSRC